MAHPREEGVAHIKAEYILPKSAPAPKVAVQALAEGLEGPAPTPSASAGAPASRGKIVRGRNAADLGIERVKGKLQASGKSLADVDNVLQRDVMLALRKRTYDFIPGTDVKNKQAKARAKNRKGKKKRKAPATYCFTWLKSKTCVYGDKCRFRHLDEIPKDPAEETPEEEEGDGKCPVKPAAAAGTAVVKTTTTTTTAPAAAEDHAASAARRAEIAPAVQAILKSRAEARANGNYSESDKQRERLKAMGVETEDLADGTTTWRVIVAETPSPKAPETSDASTASSSSSSSSSSPTDTTTAVPNAAPADVVERPVASRAPTSFPDRKTIDFHHKIYIAPLTTLGNLPFRRVMKDMGADITCGEMAIAVNVLKAQSSEWTLLRRHKCEDVFGVQIAGCNSTLLDRLAQILEREVRCDFVDLNMGCPIDFVCNKGMGSKLMCRLPRVKQICRTMTRRLSCPMTLKIRTGWSSSDPIATKMLSKVPLWNAELSKGRTGGPAIQAVTIHGRSRLQRYKNLANWDFIRECARAQAAVRVSDADGTGNSNTSAAELTEAARAEAAAAAGAAVSPEQYQAAVIGNGDVYSFTDWNSALASGELTTCMLARGALIKPWLSTEIKEQRHWDISSGERLEILRDFVKYGLEYWGSDASGVSRCRRFLLEWQSFLYRYIPLGLLERVPHRMNERPPRFRGRDDLETLMASGDVKDWVALSQLAGLPPPRDDFKFQPKHKANAYMDNGNSAISATLLAQHMAKSRAAGGPGGGSGEGSAAGAVQSQDDAPPPAKRVKTGKSDRMHDWG